MEGEGHLLQCRAASRLVAESDVFEDQLRGQCGLRPVDAPSPRLRLPHLDGGVQYFIYGLGRSQGDHALVAQLNQLAQRPEDFDSQHQHNQQRAQLHVALAHPPRAKPKGQCRCC